MRLDLRRAFPSLGNIMDVETADNLVDRWEVKLGEVGRGGSDDGGYWEHYSLSFIVSFNVGVTSTRCEYTLIFLRDFF